MGRFVHVRRRMLVCIRNRIWKEPAMIVKSLGSSLAIAFGLSLVGLLSSPAQGRPPHGYGPPPGAIVNCASHNFRYQHCRIDTRGGVQLVRQHSRTYCREGVNWGYDRRGIWVDRGCAAEFVVGSSWAGPGHPGYGPGPGWQRPVVIGCHSHNYRDAYCRAEVWGRVHIVRQISHSPCHYGRTWGYDRGGVWVRNGCSAEFRIG